MEYITININGNGECISNIPLRNLTDKQFNTLQNLVSAEQLDRDIKRQARADEWTNTARKIFETIEQEGFRLCYDGDLFELNDFYVQA